MDFNKDEYLKTRNLMYLHLVVEDISSLFTSNENINTAFSSEGITNLSNFTDFYRYVAFWVLFF